MQNSSLRCTKLAEMTALWQKDRITGRLIEAIVGAFEEALSAKPAEV
jgi:hypothetical protein